jgi:hypothetical protein
MSRVALNPHPKKSGGRGAALPIGECSMSAILGTGEHRYRVLESWAKLPDGWQLGDVAAVGVDRQDRVYVFNRGEHPMMVFDRDGTFLRSWGEGVFERPHGIHMAPDDTIFCTDDGDHSLRRLSIDGKLLATIGIPGEPAPFMSGEPFRHAHGALAHWRDLCERWLRQRADPQICARRPAPDVLGRARRRSRTIQPAAQHRL